jgi:nitrite reductase/ring-hydroxylating ferredoxin subunit
MAFEHACPLADLPPNTMRGVTVAGAAVLLVRDGDQIYALESRCGHMGGPLAEGTLARRMVTCPWHGSRWDSATGRAVSGPYHIPGISRLLARVLPDRKTYAARGAGESVEVDLAAPGAKSERT